jgi:hypothetical protein
MFSGAGLGFIIANIPGALMGGYAGNRLGAIRDAKGKSVMAVCIVTSDFDIKLTIFLGFQHACLRAKGGDPQGACVQSFGLVPMITSRAHSDKLYRIIPFSFFLVYGYDLSPIRYIAT